jgi:aminoglycoside phosphotransferase (APT) family kinase protein
LRTLWAAGLPVAEPVLLDTSGEILPAPYMILDYIPGAPVFEPSTVPDLMRKLAEALASIPTVDLARHDLAFLPVQGKGFGPPPEVPDETLDEGRIREAMARAWPVLSRPNATVLLHGDFWPGNVLWHEGRFAGIIDWEDARTGDPIVDLAKSRLEMLWAFGLDGMRSFTAHYLALKPCVKTTDLPYWELAAALEPAGNLATWGLPPAKEERFRHLHHDFVDQALHRLSSARPRA